MLWLIQFASVLVGSANLWEDVGLVEYPSRIFTRLALYAGEFPHWNPFSFGGMPFFGTGVGFLYPLNALVSLLPLSDKHTWWLLQTIITSHILIAGACMFFYLRFKGRTDPAALFGAIAFMFGGYMIAHVIHSSIIYIVAWMPLMLILLERGVNEIKPRYAVMGGLLLGAVMQAGHAQVMFYTIIFMLTYGLYFVIQSSRRQVAALIVAVFFAIGAGLCLVQYLPVFEASGHTARISYTIRDASEGSLQFVQLLTALLPKIFGAYTGQENVPGFWLQDAFRHGYYNYWETCFYFGISTLILSVFLFRKIKTDGTVMMAAGWILLSFLIALGGNFFFYKILFSLGIPGFNSFRHTPRILFIWGFLFPVMAAAVIDSLGDLKAKKLKIISLTLCAAAAVLGIITVLGGLTAVFPLMGAEKGRAEYASQQGIFLIVNSLFMGTVLILFFKDKIKLNTAKLLIVACIAVDMLAFASGQHITKRDGAHIAYRRAQAGVEQIREQRKEERFRINTRQFIIKSPIGEQTGLMLMDRNQGYVSQIETTEGYNPFRLKYSSLPLNAEKFNVVLDLMNVRHYINPDIDPKQKDANQTTVLTNETRLPRAMLFYKAKVIGADGVDEDGIDSLILNYMNSLQYDHRGEVVVTDKEFSRFTGGGGRSGNVQVSKYKNNRIELDVNTDREAILWMSEIWYPAWKATVNGNKTAVHRANHSFRAIIVPAGQSKVVFKFDSMAFNAGALISLLTLIAAFGYLLIGWLGKNKPAAKQITAPR